MQSPCSNCKEVLGTPRNEKSEIFSRDHDSDLNEQHL